MSLQKRLENNSLHEKTVEDSGIATIKGRILDDRRRSLHMSAVPRSNKSIKIASAHTLSLIHEDVRRCCVQIL